MFGGDGLANYKMRTNKAVEIHGIVGKYDQNRLMTYAYAVPTILIKFQLLKDSLDAEVSWASWIDKEFKRVES